MNRLQTHLVCLFHSLYYDLPTRWLRGFVLPCRNVTFELTYRCNLTCDFCYLRLEEEKLGRRISREDELTFEELCALIIKLPRHSNVTFVGGEVTIKSRFWDLMEFTTRRHQVTIGTNAVNFSPDICQRIVAARVSSVGTSLDGPEEIHDAIRGRGTFQKTCRSIRQIIAARHQAGSRIPRVNLNCVIIPENIPRLADVVDVASEIGVDSCTFQVLDPSLSRSGINLREEIVESEPWADRLPIVDRGVFAASLERLEASARTKGVPFAFSPLRTKAEVLDFYAGKLAYNQYSCTVPWTTTRISPTGDVFPCLNYRIGNIRQHSLTALWNHPRYREFRNRMTGRGLYQSCAGCCKMTPRIPAAPPQRIAGVRPTPGGAML